MTQTRRQSLAESVFSTVVGYWVSIVAWTWVIAPLWGFDVTAGDNIAIVAIFTVLSVVRGFGVRRFVQWSGNG